MSKFVYKRRQHSRLPHVPMTSRSTAPARPVAGRAESDAESLSASAIRHRRAAGRLVRLTRGAYVEPGLEWSPQRDLLAVALASPGVTFSLLTALHLLHVREPAAEIWVSIGHRDRKPAAGGVPIEVVRCGGALLAEGVEPKMVGNLQVNVTTAARTVVDCFKARTRVGLDVAVHALRSVRRLGLASSDELWWHAEKNEMCDVMSPYMRTA